MTRLLKRGKNRVLVIEQTKAAKCDFCGKLDELRPYGPMGENICFDCAMKDKAGTQKRFGQMMLGEPSDA